MKYDKPTPIQAKAIPFALDGRDIMGSAQTGTGKTAAFAIPLVQHLMDNPESSALVLTPTRELGRQILEIMHQLLGKGGEINTAFLIGGDSMSKQLNQIKKRPRLIVGTPGRINDHLERGTLKLNKTDFLVLDETDRMLDMGFSVQLDRIFKYMPKTRQTLMFSATLPKDILKMSQAYLNNPERIAVGSTFNPVDNITQEIIRLTDGEKGEVLLNQLDERMGSIIIFVKTKFGTERMAKRLKAAGHDAQAINGDMKQSRRERVIQDFRNMKFKILVATDVVSRGLDIPHIEHVINYDLPQVPEDYIHRIGRTARAGAKGLSLALVTPQDERKWHAIECLMNPDMKPKYAAGKGGKKSGSRGGKAHFKGKPRSGVNKRTFGDKPTYGEKKSYGEKRSYGDKKKSFGDRKESGEKRSYGDKPSYGEKRSYGDKPAYGDKKKSFGGNKDSSRSQDRFGGKRDRNHSWDGRPKHQEQNSSKPKRFENSNDDRRDNNHSDNRGDFKQREDRGYSERKDTNKKSPFKKSESRKSDRHDGDKPLSRKKHSGKPSDKPNNKRKTDKRMSETKFGDKRRGTPKGAPQKGKKVYAGGKDKKNTAKKEARRA
jgi:superfamily II DNA/RNA helicase